MHFVRLCPLEQFSKVTLDVSPGSTAGRSAVAVQGGILLPVLPDSCSAGGCKYTLGLCWQWFHVAPDSPNTLCPPTHTLTHWVLGLCRLRGQLQPLVGQLSLPPASISTPRIFWNYIFYSFCPDQLPSSLASTTGSVIQKEWHIPA